MIFLPQENLQQKFIHYILHERSSENAASTKLKLILPFSECEACSQARPIQISARLVRTHQRRQECGLYSLTSCPVKLL
ncbi:hypothetical protein [Neisseria sicca]|uniref:Mn2+/Zn2+ ABC superfamily ATP binding cassette transporter permease protein n=1 Tax=Neisseria macacae ATCC 33926 TaxID=997348 RepID=A0AA36XJU4_9NEIS|nr:hypothetical protein [Neisseria sicca]EGQ76146.1 Mn2+/Zn2+ ABC superfamily ATP binding cassette transporter permease protein [Neisseria macacae ATCC 33926]